MLLMLARAGCVFPTPYRTAESGAQLMMLTRSYRFASAYRATGIRSGRRCCRAMDIEGQADARMRYRSASMTGWRIAARWANW
ncbi:hypothetical protein ACVOMV_08090 [Mesorhizobium atlanticum]